VTIEGSLGREERLRELRVLAQPSRERGIDHQAFEEILRAVERAAVPAKKIKGAARVPASLVWRIEAVVPSRARRR